MATTKQSAALGFAIILLAVAIYSHYTMYASMYALPAWITASTVTTVVAFVLGGLAYMFFGGKVNLVQQ